MKLRRHKMFFPNTAEHSINIGEFIRGTKWKIEASTDSLGQSFAMGTSQQPHSRRESADRQWIGAFGQMENTLWATNVA